MPSVTLRTDYEREIVQSGVKSGAEWDTRPEFWIRAQGSRLSRPCKSTASKVWPKPRALSREPFLTSPFLSTYLAPFAFSAVRRLVGDRTRGTTHGRRRQHLQRHAPGVRWSGAPAGARPRHLEDPHEPQAPDHRLVSDSDGQRRDRSLHGVSRPVQHHARAGQGRHPLPPRRQPRRSHGARRLDDLEVRRGARPVRRRQGRHRLRPHAHVPPRARGAHAPLRRGDHRRDRTREGRARARRQHQRPGDGVDHGHLQHARRPHLDGGRHRQADRDGRIARTARGDRPRRDDRHPRGGQAPRPRHLAHDRGRAGIRQRRLGLGRSHLEARREDRRRHRLERRRPQSRRASTSRR